MSNYFINYLHTYLDTPPDPFSRSTKITFNISGNKDGAASQRVKLIIYNASGLQVAMAVEGDYKNGSYSVEINAGGLSPGIYYYQLTVGEIRLVKRMLVIK